MTNREPRAQRNAARSVCWIGVGLGRDLGDRRRTARPRPRCRRARRRRRTVRSNSTPTSVALRELRSRARRSSTTLSVCSGCSSSFASRAAPFAALLLERERPDAVHPRERGLGHREHDRKARTTTRRRRRWPSRRSIRSLCPASSHPGSVAEQLLLPGASSPRLPSPRHGRSRADARCRARRATRARRRATRRARPACRSAMTGQTTTSPITIGGSVGCRR